MVLVVAAIVNNGSRTVADSAYVAIDTSANRTALEVAMQLIAALRLRIRADASGMGRIDEQLSRQ